MKDFNIIIVEDVPLELKGTEGIIANDIPDEVAAAPVAPSGSPAPAEIDPPTPEFASVEEPDDLPW